MGLGLLKELKFLKVCLNQNRPSLLKKTPKFSVLIIIIDLRLLITISAVIENLQPKCGLSLFHKVNFMYKRQVGSSPVCIHNLSFFCSHLA